ncbi:MAG: serine hydrolase [Spirochaetia bacterium]|nr:serine hydrolase [Spirochaetia bacterium]
MDMAWKHPRYDQSVFEQAKKDFEGFVYGAHARGWFPSAAMGVVVGDKLVYELTIRSDRDRQYHVASITKTVTATAVMQLVERGQLNLDQTIGEILPGVDLERPELGWPKATVRNLLNHSSGLPDMRFYSSSEFVDQKTVPFPVPKIIYPPGKHFRYANHGFLLLGEIVKRRTGMTLNEYMQHNVYQPAGMTHTDGPITGAGGVRTTLHDMANFAITYLNYGVAPGEREVLRTDTVRSMLEPQTYLPFSGRVKYQGLGWRAEKNERGVTTYYHVGGDNYVAAWIQMFPQQHAAIMYLADPPEYFPALHGFLTSLQQRLGDLATILTNSPRPVYALDAALPPAELSQMYTGVYRHALSGREIEMSWKPDGITMTERDTRRTYTLNQDTAHVFLGGPIYDAHDFLVQPMTNEVMGMADVDGYYARVAPLQTSQASAAPVDTKTNLP